MTRRGCSRVAARTANNCCQRRPALHGSQLLKGSCQACRGNRQACSGNRHLERPHITTGQNGRLLDTLSLIVSRCVLESATLQPRQRALLSSLLVFSSRSKRVACVNKAIKSPKACASAKAVPGLKLSTKTRASYPLLLELLSSYRCSHPWTEAEAIPTYRAAKK